MSVTAAHGATDGAAGRKVTFKTAGDWQIVRAAHIPEGKCKEPRVALVHGPRREKDVYGQTLPRLLNEQGVTTLRIDIHGRRAVRFDVEAAINFLAYDRAWTATAM